MDKASAMCHTLTELQRPGPKASLYTGLALGLEEYLASGTYLGWPPDIRDNITALALGEAGRQGISTCCSCSCSVVFRFPSLGDTVNRRIEVL